MTQTLAHEPTVAPALDLLFPGEAAVGDASAGHSPRTRPQAAGNGTPPRVCEPARSLGSWPPDGWPRDGWPPPELLPELYWNAALWEST